MHKKGIYVLFLVLAQIAFAQKEDLCIDQSPEELNAEGHAPHHHFTMYYNPKMRTNVAPLWKRLCDIYESPDYHLSMIKNDCTSCITTCILQNIIHYPTFMFFQAGESEGITFNGEADITSLTAFIDEQLKKAETMGDK